MTAASDKDHSEAPKFLPLSLHDALALGEFELGLTAEDRERSELEEIERLPVLLRILSASRPLASIPTFDDKQDLDESGATPLDEIANQVVARLEDVAATHSMAEGVDVVACHLAPAVCRNLSKLNPLKRKRTIVSHPPSGDQHYIHSTTTIRWDTSELVLVGANPRSSIKRRRMSTKSALATNEIRDSDDIAAGLSEGIMSSDEEGDASKDLGPKERRRSSLGMLDSREIGAEDSQEEVVSKTLAELSTLVAASLEPIKVDSERDGENRSGRLTLSSEDSTFSEPVPKHSDRYRSVVTGSDLGSTVASLMHHAPVLRHQHVANALCRASVPQAASLIRKMGANCPSAVPSLLRGCIDAYNTSQIAGSRQSSLSRMSRAAVKALATLSARECSRVRTCLQQDGIMLDVQLQLAIQQDPTAAACLLLEHLSSEPTISPEANASCEKDVFGGTASKDLWRPTRLGTVNVTLQTRLEEDGELTTAALSFLQKEMSSSLESLDVSGECGRVCLLLRCYVWLVLQRGVTMKLLEAEDKILAIAPFLPVLHDMLKKLQKAASGSWLEMPLKLVFYSLILTLEALLGSEEKQKSAQDQCGAIFKECMNCRSLNAYFDAFVTKFVYSLQHSRSQSLQQLIYSVLFLDGCPSAPGVSLDVQLPRFFEWLQSSGDIFKGPRPGDQSTSYLAKLTLLLDSMDASDNFATEIAGEVRACLEDLLSKMNEYPASLELATMVPQFILRGTEYLAKSDMVNLPVVSPLQLETGAGKLMAGDASGEFSMTRLLFQVLYWFAYLDSGSDLLHTFDVRTLPLKEVLSSALLQPSKSPEHKSIGILLLHLVAKHCPELPRQLWCWKVHKDLEIYSNARRKKDRAAVRSGLSRRLKAALSSDTLDLSGARAEKSFLSARSNLSDSDLVPLVVSTLLSTPHAPAPFFTYSMLCRDPLVLLKAPMRVWQSQGLRRILLAVLAPLLENNEAVLDRISPSTIGANELVSARHLLLARCILVAVSGSDDSKWEQNSFFCSMSTSFLRMLVAKNPGLVGVLVKQSPVLPDSAIDWLIEFVPETMDDPESLVAVLTDRGSVTSKLTASASILRMAIAHGHRDEAITERLVYAALTQLVSSFFLVIGPVGVPVNVLIGDGSGQDVTQTSRKATFRMLRSLVNVRGRMRPRMRNECGLALHKLAGLCKGENLLSGVSGAVLSRRKGLLREMFEAVNKAANAMGSGIEL